jgi:hypothetical protein
VSELDLSSRIIAAPLTLFCFKIPWRYLVITVNLVQFLKALGKDDRSLLSCVKPCLSMLLYAIYSIPCVCSKENKQENKKQDELIGPLLSLA